jgi:head-tail adaptor
MDIGHFEDGMTDPWSIDAGELRQQITIEAGVAQTATSRGTITVHWPPVAGTSTVVRCKVEAAGGGKHDIARQLVPTATHRVTMRYRVALDPEKTASVLALRRLNFKGNVLNIGSIEDVEQMHVKLVLTCTEQRT